MTPDELRSVPLFAELEEPDLVWLCRVMADITLSPGEYVVHEGDAPALFALLGGHCEVVRIVDDEERVIGKRDPGELYLYGEISIVLGTPQPAGLRAVGEARVVRLEPLDYHARRRVLAARPRSVPPRDERSGHLRRRRRPLQPREARCCGGRRGQHGDRLRAPVPAGCRGPLRRRVALPRRQRSSRRSVGARVRGPRMASASLLARL